MADHTAIEWTDATWNPITGCSIVSPGCTNCYAMRLAGTRLKHIESRKGLTKDSKAGPVWTGDVRFNKQWLYQPLRWKQPRRIFVCAHGDLFAENVPDEWIDQVFAVMALAPLHTFQVLTKRPERMRAYLTGGLLEHRIVAEHAQMNSRIPDLYRWPHTPLPNVWLGVSAEDQKRADERIPELLATPAAVRFVSAEPLLGPINLASDKYRGGWDYLRGNLDLGDRHGRPVIEATNQVDWIIVGGESGPDARPMHPGWARSIRDQCAEATVPFFFKQWGAWESRGYKPAGIDPEAHFWPIEDGKGPISYRVGKKAAGRLLDGVEHSAMPEAR